MYRSGDVAIDAASPRDRLAAGIGVYALSAKLAGLTADEVAELGAAFACQALIDLGVMTEAEADDIDDEAGADVQFMALHAFIRRALVEP